jgi:hypothetical protein
VLVMNVDERRLNAMPNQIPARVPVPAVLGLPCDVCSAVFPRSAVLARGMSLVHAFSFPPLMGMCICYANANDRYIKELADRIHSIENKLESEGSLTQDEIDRLLTPGSHRAYNGLAPPEDAGRKRAFSSISATDFNAAAPRQAPWGPEPRPILPAPASSDTFTGPGYANNSLAPQPAAVKAETAPPKPPVASMDSQVVDTEEVPEVDEDSLHE